MRVLFLRANPINPDPRVEKEIRAILDKGMECYCIGWDRSANHPITDMVQRAGDTEYGIKLIGIESPFGSGAKNIPNVVKFEFAAYRWLIAHSDEYDVVHACDLDTGLAAMAACSKTRKPFVYDIFDFYCDSRIMPTWVKGFVRRLEFQVVNKARATIICTEQRKIQIRGANPRKTVIIENTPEEIVDVASARKHNNKIELAYVGVLTEGRYLDRVLDAVEGNSDIELVIGGYGPLSAEIEARACKNPRIRFYGKVGYDAALRIERDADVMLGLYDPSIANHRLAAPNKYYESLMLGTPLLAVQGTSVGDWVLAEMTGEVLAPDFSNDDFSQAVARIVRENCNGEISARQHKLYQHKHRWSIMAERLQELYSEIEEELYGGAVR